MMAMQEDVWNTLCKSVTEWEMSKESQTLQFGNCAVCPKQIMMP